MELLFRRKQTFSRFGRKQFRLHAKVELSEEEQELIKRYGLAQAVLIVQHQPELVRQVAFIAFGVFILTVGFSIQYFEMLAGISASTIAGLVAGHWYWTEKRETIMVKDLIHGRHFACKSVIDLARKEAWLEVVTGFLRQVMETSKHWDGTQRYAVDPLPKEQAKQMLIEGVT